MKRANKVPYRAVDFELGFTPNAHRGASVTIRLDSRGDMPWGVIQRLVTGVRKAAEAGLRPDAGGRPEHEKVVMVVHPLLAPEVGKRPWEDYQDLWGQSEPVVITMEMRDNKLMVTEKWPEVEEAA